MCMTFFEFNKCSTRQYSIDGAATAHFVVPYDEKNFSLAALGISSGIIQSLSSWQDFFYSDHSESYVEYINYQGLLVQKVSMYLKIFFNLKIL